jgi:putative flavoprotein involved in K+ transport
MREKHDTVIIGGGQAGLAMSYHLQQRGREHIILERLRIAERWRVERWDSLHFQLPNAWLTLPGKAYCGSDPNGFSHHSDVLRFITDYAAEIEAPVRTGVEVTSLSPADTTGEYVIKTTDAQINARQVVIATGPFQRPLVPETSCSTPCSIYQIDAIHYRNPEALPPGAVLVVGSGNSGCQIADELVRSGRRVFFSVSRHQRAPRRYRGKDVIWWYENLGRFDVNVDTFPNRKYPPTSIMTGIDGGYDIDPCRLGAQLVGRVLGFADNTMAVADNVAELSAAADKSHADFIAAADAFAATTDMRFDLQPREEQPPLPPLHVDNIRSLNLRDENISTVIWATGYGFSYDWLKLPITDTKGTPIQQRGVTTSRGVYFLGLHWMHTFRSAILSFVGRDAAYIADHIEHLEI